MRGTPPRRIYKPATVLKWTITPTLRYSRQDLFYMWMFRQSLPWLNPCLVWPGATQWENSYLHQECYWAASNPLASGPDRKPDDRISTAIQEKNVRFEYCGSLVLVGTRPQQWEAVEGGRGARGSTARGTLSSIIWADPSALEIDPLFTWNLLYQWTEYRLWTSMYFIFL
jgi:hypothetical protein